MFHLYVLVKKLKSLFSLNLLVYFNLQLRSPDLFHNFKMNTCAFCRTNGNPWNHPLKNAEGAIVCQQLLAYECPYCHEMGHTRKHCAKLAQKQVKQEQIHKKAEEKPTFNPNCWAAIASRNVSEAVVTKMREDDRMLEEQAAAAAVKRAEKDKELRQKRKEEYEKNYEKRMRRQYGLPANNQIAEPGDFWYFHVQSTRDDSDLAKRLREDKDNQGRFISYLHEKYWINWLEKSIDTEDDCHYLVKLRDEDEEREYQQELRMREFEKEMHMKEQKKEQQLLARVASGEITQQQMYDLETEDLFDDDYLWQSSDEVYRASMRNAFSQREWQKRHDAREAEKK